MDLDWQNDCHEIKDRGAHLLQTEKWSDCHFLVGTFFNQRIISGHKLILAMASPVFERMFYGHLIDTSNPIIIPDVQPEAFQSMMEYIYSDRINITSFDKACELYYVAKKYMLPHVMERCTQYLWSDLSPKNACRAYEFAKLFEETGLMKKSMELIASYTRKVIKDSSFLDIEMSTLLDILDQHRLPIESELDLVETKMEPDVSAIMDGQDEDALEEGYPDDSSSDTNSLGSKSKRSWYREKNSDPGPSRRPVGLPEHKMVRSPLKRQRSGRSSSPMPKHTPYTRRHVPTTPSMPVRAEKRVRPVHSEQRNRHRVCGRSNCPCNPRSARTPQGWFAGGIPGEVVRQLVPLIEERQRNIPNHKRHKMLFYLPQGRFRVTFSRSGQVTITEVAKDNVEDHGF